MTEIHWNRDLTPRCELGECCSFLPGQPLNDLEILRLMRARALGYLCQAHQDWVRTSLEEYPGWFEQDGIEPGRIWLEPTLAGRLLALWKGEPRPMGHWRST